MKSLFILRFTHLEKEFFIPFRVQSLCVKKRGEKKMVKKVSGTVKKKKKRTESIDHSLFLLF